MRKQYNRKAVRNKKHMKIRKHIHGTAERPRLAVFRSARHIYAQIIDDATGNTLVSASTLDTDVSGSKSEAARTIGETVAKRALEKDIDTVVFDRGGNVYHGRIQALAEGAREAGLKF